MWREMARIVGEVRPRLVFVENSPMLVGRGAALVISDLAKMGYDCQWCIVSASDCGAPHTRDRFWLKATATDMADSNSTHGERNKCAQRSEQERADTSQSSWWASEPDVGRVADGVSARVDRLKAIGNGQVPIVAATAFSILRGR